MHILQDFNGEYSVKVRFEITSFSYSKINRKI